MPEATIERVQIANTKSARVNVTLSFPLTGHSDLFMKIAENVGGVMWVDFEELAQQLHLGEDPNWDLPSTAQRAWPSASGDIVNRHTFEASEEDDAKCTLCGWGAAHECHKALAEEPVSAAAAALLEGAQEQDAEAAKEALAGRSATDSGRRRRGDNGASE